MPFSFSAEGRVRLAAGREIRQHNVRIAGNVRVGLKADQDDLAIGLDNQAAGRGGAALAHPGLDPLSHALSWRNRRSDAVAAEGGIQRAVGVETRHLPAAAGRQDAEAAGDWLHGYVRERGDDAAYVVKRRAVRLAGTVELDQGRGRRAARSTIEGDDRTVGLDGHGGDRARQVETVPLELPKLASWLGVTSLSSMARRSPRDS